MAWTRPAAGTSGEAFWRGLFAVAAGFNLAVGLPMVLAPGALISLLGMRPVEPFFPRVAGLLILVFGLGYALVSRDLARREIVLLGVVGKVGVVALLAWSWLDGSVPGSVVALGSGDLLFALAFATFLARAAEDVEEGVDRRAGRNAGRSG